MTVLALVFGVVQVLTIGGWYGCQIYSVTLVQRHPWMDSDSAYYEDFMCALARNTRWIIFGVLGAALPSWIGEIVVRSLLGVGPLWILLAVVKSVLLVFAIGCFAYLSWHVWPLRIFALPDELPAVRRRFWWTSALVMVSLGGVLAVGVVATAI